MAATGGCDTKLSGEHLVTEGVLKVLADKQVEVSGTPWLNGQKKILGFGALTANCLCTRHNSRLSPIDEAGSKLFEAIQKCGTTDSGRGHHFLVSGHDVEGWMLRSLAVCGVSGNFAADGAIVDKEFVDRLKIVQLLEDLGQWKKPIGFYLTRGVGHRFKRRDNVHLAPLLKISGDEIMGILMNIQGLEFALLAADQNIAGTGLERAIYRPSGFVIRMEATTYRIQLSWQDGIPHQDVIISSEK